MKKQLFHGVIVGALTAMGMGLSAQALAAGTDSLDLTVDANVTTGTCSASVYDGETATNTISFGNVYLSEVINKTKLKTFKLRFSNCAGLQTKTATLVVAPNNVACPNTTNGQYANASTSAQKATKTNVELWTTDTPEGSGAVRLHCWSKPPQTIDLTGANMTTPVDYPLSARLVAESNSTPADMSAGDFYSPTTFTITYQ
ncbi:fimbrial protein [Citrobacter portucalensis]|uniref:fimbrial protein n=1 Tax=Citrobacter portucalensis TaxID=1639133 RepID=UPI003BF4ABD8